MRLKYTDMLQVMQFLADLHTRSSGKGQQEILSGLDPSKTALFFGVNERSVCSVREREECCRRVRYTLKRLLNMGVHTIIVETSSLFGYYALNELIGQRDKHHFSLMAVQLRRNCCHWMHKNEKLAKKRALRNIHNLICCDHIIGPISRIDWWKLLAYRVCLAIMEKPYCIRNIGVLPLEEFNKWGPPLADEKAQKMMRRMLYD